MHTIQTKIESRTHYKKQNKQQYITNSTQIKTKIAQIKHKVNE